MTQSKLLKNERKMCLELEFNKHLPFLVAIINSSLMATKSEIPPSMETSKARENINGGISSLTNNSSLSRLIDGPGGSTNS